VDDSQPLCSIIIVTYNGRRFLDACLEPVLRQSGPSFEIILVDNGSSDGSAGHVRERHPGVKVVEAGNNLGFAGGNNLGVQHAAGKLIVLLNNDTVVEPGWLSALVEASAPDDVATTSSLVLTEGIPSRYYEKNGSINFLCHNVMRIFEKPENIFYGGGASVLFKKDLFGLPFDADYFAYCEDISLGLRARFMGYRVLHVNGSVVKHIGSATAGREKRALTTYLQERNRILTVLTFFSWWTILRILPFVALYGGAKLLLAGATRKYSFFGIVRAYAWLAMNPHVVLEKRRRMAAERRVPEREVISWMTGKLTNGESAAGRLLNAIALTWCRLVGLKTVDFLPAGSR
jgi:hypothetical protein